MKPLIISQSDVFGGAGRAAYRLHRALHQSDINSQMKVRSKKTDDNKVYEASNKIGRIFDTLRSPLGQIPLRLQKSENTNYHSGNFLPSAWAREINESAFDLVNLHWVAGEALSIKDIGRIQKPIVWTFHDMWPFCGTEHYTNDDESSRWRSGYSKKNRPDSDSGIDLDRLRWKSKLRAWDQKIHIICPSNWLAQCAQKSELFRDRPVTVIPNVLDTNIYKPLNREFCRDALNLPQNKKIVLFGVHGGVHDPRKGYDLLLEAMSELSNKIDYSDLLVVIFGQSEPEGSINLNFKTSWAGFITDDVTLALLYNSADVMVVPSRQENLPQTATEAQACGCPVVAFNSTGLRDVVLHRESGYLAKAFDPRDMANGLYWILEDVGRRKVLGDAGRQFALTQWAPDVVIPKYLHVYEEIIR